MSAGLAGSGSLMLTIHPRSSVQVQSSIPPSIKLKIVPPTDHSCYVIQSMRYNRAYIGYTVDFSRRIRQHNGEIVGGAKRTHNWRPWRPVCTIQGFFDSSSALRFEWRLQHIRKKKQRGTSATEFVIENLIRVINRGDGLANAEKIPWPRLFITWYIPHAPIDHPNIVNFTA